MTRKRERDYFPPGWLAEELRIAVEDYERWPEEVRIPVEPKEPKP